MKKILIVDDETDIRTALAYQLQGAGFEILEAADGDEAVRIAIEIIPDLVLCDIRMEKMNGFVVKEILGDDDRTRHIPFVMMTGVADTAGAWKSDPNTQYLAKPFTFDQLMSAIRKSLGT